MKKTLTGLLFLTLLLISINVAEAKENFKVTTDSSYNFISYGSGIDEYSGYIRANSYSNLINFCSLSIDMKLQRFDAGSWITVSSWYASDYNMSLNLRRTYPASPGIYKVLSTHMANGGEYWNSLEVSEEYKSILYKRELKNQIMIELEREGKFGKEQNNTDQEMLDRHLEEEGIDKSELIIIDSLEPFEEEMDKITQKINIEVLSGEYK